VRSIARGDGSGSSGSGDTQAGRGVQDLRIDQSPFPPGSEPASVTWLGHATALLEIDGVRVLTDPVLRGRVGPLVRIAAPVGAGAAGRVDCVALSHLHADHTDIPTLRELDRSGPLLVPHPAANWFRRAGLRDVEELRAGEEVSVGAVRVIATPAVHDRRRRPLGPAADPVGYVVSGSRRAYFAGDTELFESMAKLGDSLDLALLPVWGWGPDVGEGHLDPDRAAQAAALISPRLAIPIHWGTFALAWAARRTGDPSWPARRFAELVSERASGVEVRVLAPGGRTEF
jgi:L-ascorbate metabolism protein UlaG (beta-lactamase superfamily)